MTAVVGILCTDGAVIGTDSSMTLHTGAIRTIEQATEKLAVVRGRAIVAGTGSVGHGQRFINLVEQAWDNRHFVDNRDGPPRPPIELCRELCQTVRADFGSTGTPNGTYGALLAAPMRNAPVVCEFDINSLQPTLLTPHYVFCSMGSTQHITDPFLGFMREVFWPTGPPNVQTAIHAATWTLDHAIALNPGGVNGPARIAVLERNGNGYAARQLSDDEIGQHRAWIADAKSSLSSALPVAGGPDVPRVG